MTDETNKMNTLIAACWKDDALKQRFLSDPHAVLAEHGMDVPEGMNVNVVENTDTTVHVTLPAAPTANGDLSDEELSNAAGGMAINTTQLFDLRCDGPGTNMTEECGP
jgi:hypothetical protein